MIKFFKYVFTALLPTVYFLIEENNKAALICFVLQLTFVGWLPAAIWACRDLKSKLKVAKKELHDAKK